MSPRRIVFLLYPGLQPLDVVGPHEVFAGANAALSRRGREGRRYGIDLVAVQAGAIRGESGLAMYADSPLPDARRAVDTIVVPGGEGSRAIAESGGRLVDWLSEAAPRSRRVATVCSGTFIAAAAGLCDGRRVTTHWSRAGQLAAFCPGATVEPDAIHVRDGDLWSSAGVTAGIDLALALVEDDLGTDIAQLVARHLVVHLRRAGGQSQYAGPVWNEPPALSPVREACDLVLAEPAADHGVSAMATRVGLSHRHFTRMFRTQVGESPARFVERVRVDAARQILTAEAVGLDEVAKRCGFGSVETLRRAFHRRLGLTPDHYRRRFTTT